MTISTEILGGVTYVSVTGSMYRDGYLADDACRYLTYYVQGGRAYHVDTSERVIAVGGEIDLGCGSVWSLDGRDVGDARLWALEPNH